MTSEKIKELSELCYAIAWALKQWESYFIDFYGMLY
jgi:hypothetical protein